MREEITLSPEAYAVVVENIHEAWTIPTQAAGILMLAEWIDAARYVWAITVTEA